MSGGSSFTYSDKGNSDNDTFVKNDTKQKIQLNDNTKQKISDIIRLDRYRTAMDVLKIQLELIDEEDRSLLVRLFENNVLSKYANIGGEDCSSYFSSLDKKITQNAVSLIASTIENDVHL